MDSRPARTAAPAPARLSTSHSVVPAPPHPPVTPEDRTVPTPEAVPTPEDRAVPTPEAVPSPEAVPIAEDGRVPTPPPGPDRMPGAGVSRPDPPRERADTDSDHDHVTLVVMAALRRASSARPRNDLGQYEQLADEWWRPSGAFAMLHWIAQARAALIPPAPCPGAVLVDLGCGAGLLAPHVATLGYRHVGIDLVRASLTLAGEHGVSPVRADVHRLPLHDESVDVVSAGEILEHVPDPSTVVSEACRVLRPGGLLVLDTINATWWARLIAVTVAERVGLAPKRIHDPRLFVPPDVLRSACARHGVTLTIRGLRPAAGPLIRWLLTRRGTVPIVPAASTAALYQGWGTKEAR
jgi:2-polyprenyl-6-hydroxyphenyl methylase/3-demethylubiquinone-9 3-methyltransferase